MKNQIIHLTKNRDIYSLWFWRVSLIFTAKIEDKRKIGIWKNKYSIMVFISNFGIGIGHSIGINSIAYTKSEN